MLQRNAWGGLVFCPYCHSATIGNESNYAEFECGTLLDPQDQPVGGRSAECYERHIATLTASQP